MENLNENQVLDSFLLYYKVDIVPVAYSSIITGFI